MPLIFHSANDSPRLRYTLDLVFDRWLGLPYQLLTNRADYLASEGPRLHYGQERLCPDELFLPASRLLFEQEIRQVAPVVHWQEGLPFLFEHSSDQADFGFDLLAFIFHSVTRYEEYRPFAADRHGRFPADQSLAGRHGFLQLPWVDAWLGRLRSTLTTRFPELPVTTPAYRFHLTYDVDLAWAYRCRPLWRTAGGLLRDLLCLDHSRLGDRLSVLAGRRPDPFFTFPYLEVCHQRHQLNPLFFFLTAGRGRFDRGISPAHPEQQRLIRSLAEQYPVGIHPSYRSNDEDGVLQREVDILRAITGKPIQQSRQHFLRLRFPATYRDLLAAGIRHDYTLGFADAPGFRAGTARSFPWYDLAREEPTPLLLHPFQVMDATLRKYQRWSPRQAQSEVFKLIGEVRRNGGTFRLLWHNSSFAQAEGWDGWKSVFEAILHEASAKNEAPNQR